MDFDREHDRRVREAAFAWLDRLEWIHGEVLPRRELQNGFPLRGERVHLVSPQGIFTPRTLAAPLSILTVHDSPYADERSPSGLFRYMYRGTDSAHRDNVGLRFAMEQRLPLVYFLAVARGRYQALRPAHVLDESRNDRSFWIGLGEPADPFAPAEPSDLRHYATTEALQRLHQGRFRERVLDAYRERCAFCSLRHRELLDAAHIIPDSEPGGVPEVRNGIALCRLHHATFDRYVVGIRPRDHVITVRPDVMEEEDGPTLRYAIQGLDGQRMALPPRPGDRPGREFLETRYERFLAVAPS